MRPGVDKNVCFPPITIRMIFLLHDLFTAFICLAYVSVRNPRANILEAAGADGKCFFAQVWEGMKGEERTVDCICIPMQWTEIALRCGYISLIRHHEPCTLHLLLKGNLILPCS